MENNEKVKTKVSDAVVEFLKELLISVRSEVHNLAEIIYHAKDDGLQVSISIPTADPKDAVWSTAMLPWSELDSSKHDLLAYAQMNLGKDILGKVGQSRYKKCVEMGFIQDAQPWDKLTPGMREIWSQKDFDIKKFLSQGAP
jgi:hypothetical protein